MSLRNSVKIGQTVSAQFCNFQDGGRRHLGFLKIQNFNGWSVARVQYASSCQMSSQSVERSQRYGDLTGFFSKWRLSAVLDLLGAYWDHPRWPLGGLYRFVKFGENRCSSFDNTKLSIFCLFGLKTPIHALKLGFSWYFTMKMGSNINKTPIRHIFARVRVVWAIKRENPSTGLTNLYEFWQGGAKWVS